MKNIASPVGLYLQFMCSEQDDVDKILAEVRKLDLLSVRLETSLEQAQADGGRCEIAITTNVIGADGSISFTDMLDVLENIALNGESVVPETVRVTMAAPTADPIVIGQYVDFLESKIDHLMVRTLNLQE